jgi:hypothetical protein
LFDRITWSTERVLGETIERAREIGLEVVLLPEWFDVDSARELRRLRRELADDGHDTSRAENTRRFILSRWPADSAFHK